MMHDKPQILDPAEKPTQLILTDKLQLGGVLEHLLEFTGPADVLIASFSVGEEFARKIIALRKAGRVRTCELYIDMKAAEKTARTRELLAAAFDAVHYCMNHAKVIAIEGDRLKVAVLSTQNGTRGTRNEGYFIANGGLFTQNVRLNLRNIRACRAF